MSEQVKESLFTKIARLTVKAIGMILVFGTIIFFIWRAFISTIVPAEVDGLSMNDKLHTAWQTAESAGESLTLFSQAQGDTTSAEKNYSYFSAITRMRVSIYGIWRTVGRPSYMSNTDR